MVQNRFTIAPRQHNIRRGLEADLNRSGTDGQLGPEPKPGLYWLFYITHTSLRHFLDCIRRVAQRSISISDIGGCAADEPFPSGQHLTGIRSGPRGFRPVIAPHLPQRLDAAQAIPVCSVILIYSRIKSTPGQVFSPHSAWDKDGKGGLFSERLCLHEIGHLPRVQVTSVVYV